MMSTICQISLISKHFSLGKNTINVVDHYWLNWYRQGYSKATEAKDLLHSGQIVCPLNICITKNQSEVMQCEVDHIFALVTVSFIFEPCTDLEWFNIILYRSCAIIFLILVLSYPLQLYHLKILQKRTSTLKDINQDILSQASWPAIRKSGLDRMLLWCWCYTVNLSHTLYLKLIDSLGRWYDNRMLIRIENFCKMSSNWIFISRYLKIKRDSNFHTVQQFNTK